MANINVSVINASTVRTDEQIQQLTKVLQEQVRKDFAPVWGIDANLTFVAKGQTPDKSTWWLAILDDSDQAGALGYHDVTDAGLPLGKVFAKTDDTYKQQYSVTASHELLEMLGDPDINLTAFVEQPDGRSGRLYAYEVCDACEADDYAYPSTLDSTILVSDFVFPSWFESFWGEGQTQFDFKSQIKKPFDLLPGGYIGYYDVSSGAGWQQLTASKLEKGARTWAQHRAAPGSRRYRRRIVRSHWIHSRTL
jgi:hypothetical protein